MGANIPSLSSGRCAILVMDGSAIVFRVSGKRVSLLREVSLADAQLSRLVTEIITEEANGLPVLIINDTAEQYYRKEKIPNVSTLDRAGVINRKLQATYPSYPIRGALAVKPVKEKTKPTEAIPAKGVGPSYFFCALPATDSLSKITRGIRDSLASVSGLVLLPIEATGMVGTLSQKLLKDKQVSGTAAWKVFVSQNSAGGLRQIVLKGTELVLTRLTPVPDPDLDPAQWALEVLQEIKNTMTYLARFGYKDGERLEILAVAPPKNLAVIRDISDIDAEFVPLSLDQAAQMLGLRLGSDADRRFSDALYVGWIAQKSFYTLPLQSQELRAVAEPRRHAQIAQTVLAFAALGALGYLGYLGNTYLETYNDLSQTRETREQLQEELDAELARKEALGIDVNLVVASLQAAGLAKQGGFDPLPLLERIGNAMPRDLRFEKMDMKIMGGANHFDSGAAAGTGTAQPVATPYSLVLGIRFPDSLKPEDGNKKVFDLQATLQKALGNEFSVTITKKVADLSFTGQFNTKFGVAPDAQPAAVDQTAEISIVSAGSSNTTPGMDDDADFGDQ